MNDEKIIVKNIDYNNIRIQIQIRIKDIKKKEKKNYLNLELKVNIINLWNNYHMYSFEEVIELYKQYQRLLIANYPYYEKYNKCGSIEMKEE